jgi:hypothetical protein
MMPVTRPTPRKEVIAALVAAPALATVLWIAVVETYGATHPARTSAVQPASTSLAEAIRRDDVEGAFMMVRNGQDPNRPFVVDDQKLTGGRSVRVSPVLYAVAHRSSSIVRMLLAFGARPELPPDVMAACLADARHDGETAQVLRSVVPAIAAHQCPVPLSGEPYPLMALLK